LQGINTPPEIILEIDMIKEKIARLLSSVDEKSENRISNQPANITDSKIRHYMYISRAKIDMLYPQIPNNLRKNDIIETNYDKLRIVVNYIDKYIGIGTVKKPGSYFSGRLPLYYGKMDNMIYFGGHDRKVVFGLAGSLYHVINPNAIPTIRNSYI